MSIEEPGLGPIFRLSRDLKQAAQTMSAKNARFLVDDYYILQESRKSVNNQISSMKGDDGKQEEPHSVLVWFAEQCETLETQIKRALDTYTEANVVGRWAKANHGIGPVLTAGLLAHIDITRCPTAGHIWSFAGLDPRSVWNKGEKRPWNAQLKVLCWKASQSFMKFHNNKNCHYGHLYKTRKEYEIERNENGGNVETAAKILEEKNIGKSTEAYKHLSSGKLPPAQIDARARRYAVKIFLSHLHMVWYFVEFGRMPVKPYPISHLGHAHLLVPQHQDLVPGFAEAIKKWH